VAHQGWLVERGLTLSQLDRHLAARLPRQDLQDRERRDEP
jgi:hypothetical protein